MVNITTRNDGSVIVNTVKGLVGLDEIANFISDNIDSWIGKSELWDISEMDFNDISTEDLRVFVQKAAITSAASKRSGGKTAIVAPKDLQFGMMRSLESFTEISSYETTTRIFRTMNEAKSWLSEC
jgi:hypothetical protein